MLAPSARLLACLAAAAGLAAAAPALDIAAGLRPSRDSWYAVPDGLDALAPGAILRHRPPPSPIAAFGVLPVNLQASHQILYRTTDSLGNATATALTVLVPHNADTSKVLSYQVAEDAATIDCAPSYAFQLDHDTGPNRGTIVTEAELLLVEGALERGWVVIVPDFLGPHGAFLANALAGYATLDGIRAAINSGPFTGIAAEPTVAMWGYSGGSSASVWAAELQPSYAPELRIAGAAVGGTVPNVTNVVGAVNGQSSAGLLATGIVGLMNQFPALVPVVDAHLLPRFRDDLFRVRSQCLLANSAQFINADVLAMFDDRDILYTDPTAKGLLAANGLGNATPRIPMFVYKSMHDEISSVQDTDALVAKYCSEGTSVEYQRDQTSDHQNLAVLAAPRALSWLIGTMDGEDRHTGCSTKTVESSLRDREALKVLPKIIIDALLDLLGKPVGPIIG